MTASTHVGGTCAVLTCQKIILLSSRRYCDQHSALEATAASRDLSATNLAKGFRPSNRTLVARRGGGKFVFTPSQHISRPDPVSQQAFCPDNSARVAQSSKANEKEVSASCSVREDSVDATNRSHRLQQEHAVNHLESTPNSARIRPTQDVAKTDGDSSASQVKSHTVPDTQNQLDTDLQAMTESTTSQLRDPVMSSQKHAPSQAVGSEVLLTRDLKIDARKNGQISRPTASQSSAWPVETVSKAASSNGVFKKIEPSPGPSSESHVSATAYVKPIQSISDGGVKLKSSPRQSKSKENELPKHSEHHYLETRKTSKAKLSSTPTKRPAPLPSKGLPVRKRHFQGSPLEDSAEVDDEVNMADVSDIDEEVNPVKTVPLSLHAKAEARRKKLLVDFDSEAFDSLIYRQSNLRPPPQVQVSSRIANYNTIFDEQKPLYLPVNPAVHHMHKRSRAWYKKKCEEIRRRPKRKEWFGKVVERQRWLRAMEIEQQEKSQEAERDGTAPPYKPPEPRGVKRTLDFGDVPEEELPEYVRSNPAWLKACAWFRECEKKAAARQRHVNNKTKETESYFQSLNA
ncbi:hypothetical protein FBEOM_601 [Fusarium beomiforme]|uniref:Uncharacterized protein n=1 Tax=Fusarium beomiforme TaxID=44412 RepID=A0A9P5E1Q5_9HYPO|nr:hypothetical protein FBEOM_601 [Fusarium beomiforme]